MNPFDPEMLNHTERLALFRHAIVADLVVSDLPKGDLQRLLKERANLRYRPPGSDVTRTWHWKTLQRWLFAARKGLAALKPVSRQRGSALAIDDDARQLLLDMRSEHPHVAADIILDEAVRNGVVKEGAVSAPTVRRLFAKAQLSRGVRDRPTRSRDRRRWEADRPCRVWHADVCHGWQSGAEGRNKKAYIHGILDDNSRYVVNLAARDSESENDLIVVLVEALLRYPAPDVFYVDNGATYRGDALAIALENLGIQLVKPQPYDPQARGKMERFWRTLRQRLLDVDPKPKTLQQLNAAMLAWVDTDYHPRKHGGLLGQTPRQRFSAGVATLPPPRTARELALALQVKRGAKIRKDATFSVNGQLYEVRGRHLAGKTVDVVMDPLTDRPIRVLLGDTEVRFSVCDAVANASRPRGDAQELLLSTTPFDRVAGLLQAAREVTSE